MTEAFDVVPFLEVFDQAFTTGKYDEAKTLLSNNKYKININEKDREGSTYVIRACLSNNLEGLKWLYENGGDLNVQSKSGKPLLFLAVDGSDPNIITFLIDKNTELLQDTYNGQTPLHAAVNNNRLEIVKLLTIAGLDSEIQNQDGKTPFALAHENQYVEILKWLLIYKSFQILDGADEEGKVIRLDALFGKYGYEYLNVKSDKKITIAEHAASHRQIEVLKWLKSKNIHVDESDLIIEDPSVPKKTYNLLLIGETGVGKSTFINAFTNYLSFNSLEDAEKADTIHSLIPSNFTVTDDNFEPRLIKFGYDRNEETKPGSSATQAARSYVFRVGNTEIRLIDTPGIGDTRGINKDEENFDRLLTVIGELGEIHGICILLKPNNARLTVLFEYCVKQLLSRLQKSASKNIIFLFTNSRGTFYRPGDTIGPLKEILKEIKSKPPYVEIKFGKRNTFCLDNEAFRFLVARRDGVLFEDKERDNFSESWSKSANVSIELLQYVKTLPPHKIQDTVSLNESRRLILRLSKPLAEVAQNIRDNIDRIDRFKVLLSDKTKDINDLKQYLNVPRIGLNVNKLNFPMTVCTNKQCTEPIKVDDSTKINYKQICHSHCYLSGIPKEVIGDIGLQDCWAMLYRNGSHWCRQSPCQHHYLQHMHIYYTTESYNYTVEDKNVVSKIDKNKIDMEDIEEKIKNLNKSSNDYKNEMDEIQKSMAKFAHFLKNNAITAFNDTYKKYIEYLIEREKTLDDGGNKKRIDEYINLISTYENYKKTLEKELLAAQLADPNVKAKVSAQDVVNIVKNLYKLPLSGNIIKQFYAAQEQVVSGEIFRNTERTIRPRIKQGTNRSWWQGFKNVFNLQFL